MEVKALFKNGLLCLPSLRKNTATSKKTKGAIMICKKCGYEWEYKGVAHYYCCCPRCRSNVRIKTEMQ